MKATLLQSKRPDTKITHTDFVFLLSQSFDFHPTVCVGFFIPLQGNQRTSCLSLIFSLVFYSSASLNPTSPFYIWFPSEDLFYQGWTECYRGRTHKEDVYLWKGNTKEKYLKGYKLRLTGQREFSEEMKGQRGVEWGRKTKRREYEIRDKKWWRWIINFFCSLLSQVMQGHLQL